MVIRRCTIPIVVRLRGIPDDDRLTAAARAITRAITERLRTADRIISAREGLASWHKHYASPLVRFCDDGLDDDQKRRVASAVEAAIARAIAGGPAAKAPSSPFVLAQYHPPDNSAAQKADAQNDKAALDLALRMLDTLPRGEQRTEMIGIVVDLAMGKGTERQRATQRVIQLLKGVPTKNFDDHWAAGQALLPWTAKDVRAYELLLYARYWYADQSQAELSSGLAYDVFRKYLHYNGGRWAIAFLRGRITGGDILQANLAARIVADLLEGADSPEEQKYRANYAALRAMARANGWESFGPLGAASVTARIFAALDILRDQTREMLLLVDRAPVVDQWETADKTSLQNFLDGLSATGPTATGDILHFSALNRDAIEHALLNTDASKSSEWLDEMATAYTIAVDAGARLQGVTEVLHSNARALDQMLGTPAFQTDERQALFDLRHEYIDAWLSAFGQQYKSGAGGIAASYQSRLDAVQDKFERFDKVIAQRKFKSARERFQKYSDTWDQGNRRYPGNDKLDEQFFFAMRRVLEREASSLKPRFARSFGASFGGMKFGYIPSPDDAPTDLREVSQLDADTSLFGLQAGIFLMYATNLSIHNMMITAVESRSFREEQAKTLTAMRAAMEQAWTNTDFDTFIKNSDGYGKTLQAVVEKIQDRVKLEFLLGLAITLIAALITEGAALAVRLAALSETLAIMRTARAISSVQTLFEIGVFTTVELSAQHWMFGKPIGAVDVVKAVGTNLAFAGALKGVGKFAEMLPAKSAAGKLIMGHLIGFSGVAIVSATMTRIETGQWPQDIGLFLAQTATTYLLIAGMQLAFRELVANPKLKGAANARLESLNAANEVLFSSFRERVDNGTLTPVQFEAMKAERVRLLKETRAIARLLHDAGVMTPAELASIEKMADSAIAEANGAIFPLAQMRLADLALPAPDSIVELVHVGDSNIYVYDPAKPRGAIDGLLAKYRAKGFRIQGSGALTTVIDPQGRTRFVLTGSTLPIEQLVLPAASSATPPPADTQLARATGLNEAQLAETRAALAKVNREMESKLAAEYPDHAVVAALQLLVEQLSSIAPNWPIDAVRGLSDMMATQRGITRAAVRRLFQAVDPKALPGLFEAFHEVVNSSKVSAGSQFLVGDDLLPGNSVILIDAYRTLKGAGLELPADMDIRAVRGLLLQVKKMPGGWRAWLGGISKAERGKALRALTGLTDPLVRLPKTLTETLASVSQDIPGQPGLNPLAGPSGEAFVKQLEARASGKFADPRQRLIYVLEVDDLRRAVGMLEQGGQPPSNWEKIIGQANKVRAKAQRLLSGATIEAAVPSPRPQHQPLVTARGDLTPAGLAYVRSHYGEQDIKTGMNPRRVEDISDAEINQEFSHQWKWLEDIFREEATADWAERKREAEERGVPFDDRLDFPLLEGRALNTIVKQLQEAAKITGHTVNTSVLSPRAGDFIRDLVRQNDPVVTPAFELCERLAAEARERRKTQPPGSGKRPEDFADRWEDFLSDFGKGTIGAKKPDILEVMLTRDQIVVSDPSLAYSDPIHNFKLAVYRAVLERLINVQVGATDIRSLLRQTLAGP
jgi:hypothetical protein